MNISGHGLLGNERTEPRSAHLGMDGIGQEEASWLKRLCLRHERSSADALFSLMRGQKKRAGMTVGLSPRAHGNNRGGGTTTAIAPAQLRRHTRAAMLRRPVLSTWREPKYL